MKHELVLVLTKPETRTDDSAFLTGIGDSLYRLEWMWEMSPEMIIEKLLNEAVLKEEEENIIDGEYRRPQDFRITHQYTSTVRH
jgi:hypothetical protein